MEYFTCEQCGTSTPTSWSKCSGCGTLRSNVGPQRTEPCSDRQLNEGEHDSPAAEEVSRRVDLTVCFECGADNGDTEWETIAELPFCDKCSDYFRNRPFPAWLKVASIVFLCVTALAFAYNWRFFMAYVELLRGQRALVEGRFEKGVVLLLSAGERVPEIPEVGYLGKFCRAQQLIDESPEEALALLDDIDSLTPPDMQDSFKLVRMAAELYFAFDQHDYDAFLEKARQREELAPNDGLAVAGVASALACKYVTTGEDEFRILCLDKLAEAEKLAANQADSGFEEFQNRIRHRLDSREIISPAEFYQRFPDGWKQNPAP
jgi:ribosomal protein L40E